MYTLIFILAATLASLSVFLMLSTVNENIPASDTLRGAKSYEFTINHGTTRNLKMSFPREEKQVKPKQQDYLGSSKTQYLLEYRQASV